VLVIDPMPQFFLDAFDIALFRAKPLDRYAYDWRIPVVWLTLLGCLPALDAGEFHASVAERLVFFIALTWAHAVLLSVFLGWWLRLGKRWQGEGSLFPLVVLVNSTALLMPVLAMVPDAGFGLAFGVLGLYQAAVLVHALMRSTGVKLGRAVLGVLAFLPTALLLWVLATQLAVNAGWIDVSDLPTDADTPSAVDLTPGDS
jgi:hypothetical protein